MKFELYQRIALSHDLPEHRLRQGDIGTLIDFVPHPQSGETGCVVELFNALGDSLAVVALPLSMVEPLRADEIIAVRSLAQV